MIGLATHQRASPDAPSLDLDVEIALRLDGFRWVRWLAGESPDPPRDSAGRFLARRGGPLAHLQAAAPPSMPLARQPYRHLPRYSLDEGVALGACDRAGLFRAAGARLGQDGDGTWTLDVPWPGFPRRDPSLPLLLTRAIRWWLDIRHNGRKSFP